MDSYSFLRKYKFIVNLKNVVLTSLKLFIQLIRHLIQTYLMKLFQIKLNNGITYNQKGGHQISFVKNIWVLKILENDRM